MGSAAPRGAVLTLVAAIKDTERCERGHNNHTKREGLYWKVDSLHRKEGDESLRFKRVGERLDW